MAFAATPVPGASSCEIEVTLVRTDGSAVNLATDTVTGASVVEFAAYEMHGLYQEEAGAVTLQIESTCNYAATITQPQA